MAVSDIRYALESKTTLAPNNLSQEDLRQAGCCDRVCVLPLDFNERAQYLGGVLVQMLCRSSLDDHLKVVVGQLCQSLSYMLNSVSWREGKLHDFDYDELQRKLKRFVKSSEQAITFVQDPAFSYYVSEACGLVAVRKVLVDLPTKIETPFQHKPFPRHAWQGTTLS